MAIKSWTQKLYNNTKDAIVEEIKSIDPESRLQVIKDRLSGFHGASSEENLRHFIHLMMYLRELALRAKDDRSNKIKELAYNILTVEEIKPSTSRLSFLYSHIHILLSHIYLKKGEKWRAAWEQQTALHVCNKDLPNGRPYQVHAMAIRAFRLGFLDLAESLYLDAEDSGLADKHMVQSRIGRIICLRLGRRADEATALINNSRTLFEGNVSFQNELDWESACLEIDNESLDSIFKLLNIGESHYSASYLCEAFLWAYSHKSRKWIKKIPLMRTLVRKKTLDFGAYSPVVKFCRMMEDSYDSTIPFLSRLSKVGENLNEIENIGAIDKMLLAWVAVTRWLVRSNSKGLARLTFSEYKKLSLGISGGKTQDSLGICEDLLTTL